MDPLEAIVGVADLDAGEGATLVDQGAFDALADLAACFARLGAALRARLVDAASAGACSVAAGASALLEQQLRLVGSDAGEAVALEVELGRHRAALKGYLWLAHALTAAADDEAARGGAGGGGGGGAGGGGGGGAAPAAAASGAAAATAPPGTCRKHKATAGATAAAAPPAAWAAAWDGPCREATLRGALAALSLDLSALYRGLANAERPIALALDMALRAAESPEAMRAGGSGAAQQLLADDPADAHAAALLAAAAPTARAAVVRLLALGAARYGQSEYVARQLLARARRHDHVPALAAAAAAHAEASALNSSTLGVCLVAEFCRPSPRDYDGEAQRSAPGVKRAAELLVALAEAAPRTVANQMSVLQPYLACSAAATVRAAVVSAAGTALRRVYCPGAISAATAAGAARAHLRSKEHLLGLLRARVLDKAAYVRQRALRTWAGLVDSRCVPLSWWNALLAAAVGRLEDESRLVSRDALGLLCRMVHANPFGPALETARFEATLALYEAQVGEAEARSGGGGDGGGGGGGRGGGGGGGGGQGDAGRERGQEGGEGEEGGGDADEDRGGGEEEGGGAAWARGDVHVVREEEGEEEGEEGGNERAGEEGGGPRPMAADEPAAAADLPSDGDLQRLRHLVASLREAVAFCRALTAAMPRARSLLAQPSADSVQQAVVLLALCRRFRVPGAESALRAMWPLVFSREEGVRRAALDAWHDLYVLVPAADVEAALERMGGEGGAGDGGGGGRRGGGGGGSAASAATVAAQLQAANLMALTDGCTVGELDSLEAMLAQLACPPDGSPARLQARPLLLQVLAAAAAAKRALVGAAAAAAAAPPRGRGGTSSAAAGDGDAAPRQGRARDGADQVAALQQSRRQQLQQHEEEHEEEQEDPEQAPFLAAARRTLARAAVLTSLLAGARPAEVAPHAAVVADVGLARETGGRDPWVARHAALALARCAPAMLGPSPSSAAAGGGDGGGGASPAAAARRGACAALARFLLSAPPSAAAADDWPAAAEACLQALFALHTRPHALVSGLLAQMWRDCGLELAGQRAAEAAAAAQAEAEAGAEATATGGGGGGGGGGDKAQREMLQQRADAAMSAAAGAADPAALARAFFVLGQAALQQLLLAERAARAARARRAAEDKAALSRAQRAMDAAAAAQAGPPAAAPKRGGAKAASGGAKGTKKQQQEKEQKEKEEEEEDIGAQVLGVASAGSAADFDARVDAAAQLAEAQVLGGAWAPYPLVTSTTTTTTAAVGGGKTAPAPALLLGARACALSRYCHTRAMLSAPPALQQAALLALTQLMAADAAFCARHLPLAFTLLLRRLVPAGARCNLVVALADLAGRYPNLLEPWSASLFASLADGDGAVVRCALRALTHLALGGVVRPRGHVSRVAVLLVDADPEVRARAAAFFAGLASTASGGGGGRRPGAAAGAGSGGGGGGGAAGSAGASAATNPVYNLLPDILSSLCRDATFSEDKFATVMSLLLSYVKQDRQADSLRERLCARFDPAAAQASSGNGVSSGGGSSGGGGGGGPREWRMLAFCLASLGYSDRSARRMMDMLRCYRHALAEDAVFRVFATVCERAKKSAAAGALGGGGGGGKASAAAAGAGDAEGATGGAPDARERVAEYEAELLAARAQALEAREVEAACAREVVAAAAAAAAGGGAARRAAAAMAAAAVVESPSADGAEEADQTEAVMADQPPVRKEGAATGGGLINLMAATSVGGGDGGEV